MLWHLSRVLGFVEVESKLMMARCLFSSVGPEVRAIIIIHTNKINLILVGYVFGRAESWRLKHDAFPRLEEFQVRTSSVMEQVGDWSE